MVTRAIWVLTTCSSGCGDSVLVEQLGSIRFETAKAAMRSQSSIACRTKSYQKMPSWPGGQRPGDKGQKRDDDRGLPPGAVVKRPRKAR
jgi:hypothetical protein